MLFRSVGTVFSWDKNNDIDKDTYLAIVDINNTISTYGPIIATSASILTGVTMIMNYANGLDFQFLWFLVGSL